MHLWMNGVRDACLAIGEGNTEKISDFQGGTKSMNAITPVDTLSTELPELLLTYCRSLDGQETN